VPDDKQYTDENKAVGGGSVKATGTCQHILGGHPAGTA
jgi:hypothetical protein